MGPVGVELGPRVIESSLSLYLHMVGVDPYPTGYRGFAPLAVGAHVW